MGIFLATAEKNLKRAQKHNFDFKNEKINLIPFWKKTNNKCFCEKNRCWVSRFGRERDSGRETEREREGERRRPKARGRKLHSLMRAGPREARERERERDREGV